MNNNLQNMLCLDVFLQSLSDTHKTHLWQSCIRNFDVTLPLHSLDIISQGWQIQKKFELQCLVNWSRRFHWQEDIYQILDNSYEALVLTDFERKILWVNEGFEIMTGYKSCEAVGRKPIFLQGKSTEPSIRLLFRQKLQEEVNFTLTITNHRKNGEPYLCKVDIFPLHNAQNVVSHFLALETEVVA
ncbi:MAG: PAS domain-containing protein [Raineya sp.]|nr:PAS domain-containing protein [Raineya sp.]MDW8295259.1 PAS domain-containing protein [Raineya sp.]